MTINETKISETPMFPFLISSHSSISVESQSKTFRDIPTPKPKPIAAVIAYNSERPYCANMPPQLVGSNILPPFTMFELNLLSNA